MFLMLVFSFIIQVAAQAKKPNILLILADDVGTGDVPSYWNSSVVEMPNLDRLAKMGVTFKDVHSTPLFAPSRYMLLSGNYAHRGSRPNGSWGLWENGNQFLTHQKSIAEVFVMELDIAPPWLENGTLERKRLLLGLEETRISNDY